MKTLLLLCLFIVVSSVGNAQSLYVKTFGENKEKPIVFLHGGPGYNAVNFELTTAQQLAEKGFFVVVYDRRGEGRSEDVSAAFTLEEACNDITALCDSLQLGKVHLFGHSFGGALAARYAVRHPERVQSVVLIAAPLAFQEIFSTILTASKELYTRTNDSTNLRYIALLEQMDTSSIQYSSYCFMHAMRNGFYSPKEPTQEAKALYAELQAHPMVTKYASRLNYKAPQGFWKNEQYTTIELTKELHNIKSKGIPVFALYGKDDGLYSKEHVERMQNVVGTDNLMYFSHCSHNVFVDQQKLFLDAIAKWLQ